MVSRTADDGRLGLTRRLAEFVVETPAQRIPEAARSSAQRLMADTIGVSLLASAHPVGVIAAREAAAARAFDATSSVFGRGNLRVSAGAAARANGIMANALDFDGGGHLPTHILPALLAAAERDGHSGAEVTAAFVLAYEASAILTRVIDAVRKEKRGPTYRGWWHVGLVGPIAATLAVCRLSGKTTRETCRAIGIASASSAGFRQNMGSMTKALHSGNAARAGIESVLLGDQGFTADEDVIGGPLGFVAAITLSGEAKLDAAKDLGASFRLERFPGVKKYPAVSPAHGVIEGAIELARRPGFQHRDVRAVTANFRSFSLDRKSVTTVEDAGFCAPYLIASALVHGEFGPRQLRPDVLLDPRVLDLMAQVKQAPRAGEGESIVRLELANGETMSARAEGKRAFDEAFIAAKFRACAAEAFESGVDRILARASELESFEHVRELMALCRGAETETKGGGVP